MHTDVNFMRLLPGRVGVPKARSTSSSLRSVHCSTHLAHSVMSTAYSQPYLVQPHVALCVYTVPHTCHAADVVTSSLAPGLSCSHVVSRFGLAVRH